MNKKLVVYFSYTGNTRKIVNIIKDKLNCDILEIETIIPYSSDYQTVVDEEQNRDASYRLPDIKEFDINLDNYDTIIIGTPVWWYNAAPAIRKFLTEYDLSGKTIVPFATNAGWLGKTFTEIKKLCPNSNVINEMNIVFESYSDNLVTKEEDIDRWINLIE